MSFSNGHLHWREPLILFLVIVPWLVMAWNKRRPPSDRLTDFADPPLLQRLLSGAAQSPLRAVSLTIAWSLAVVAAAGPYWQPLHPAQSQMPGVDIAVIVDISPSMNSTDITPTRLDRVKHELHDFTKLLRSDRIGLVAFSANAYPMVPLTTDYDAFLQFVDLLNPSLTTLPGSNLVRALEVGEQLLSASDEHSRAIVLLSDGDFHDTKTLAAARRLGNKHIPFFVIGVGTDAGSPVPDNNGHFIQYQGHTVISHLDRNGLRSLAKSGQGAYFDLKDDDSEWRALLTRLHERTRAAMHAAQPAVQDIALYPWLLSMSLLLFLLNGARRREGIAFLILPLLLIKPTQGHAAPWSEQRAYEALQQGYYGRAQSLYDEVDSYSGRMGEGTASYRLQDWKTALNAFQDAVQRSDDNRQKARALYNTGNTLAQLHRFKEASDTYRAALHLQPNLTQAALNLSLVNQLLDAQHGEQQRKNAKNSVLPDFSPGNSDADQLDQNRRGNDITMPSNSSTPGREDSLQSQPGSRSNQSTGNSNPTPETYNERLQQTLALWHNATDNGGGSPDLESLKDNSTEFLRRRFRQEDFGAEVMIIEDKPW